MTRFLFALSFVALLAFLAQPALGQDIVIDWAIPKLTASPPEVSKSTSARIVVMRVNDILYDYHVDLVPYPRTPNDWEALLQAAGAGPIKTMVNLEGKQLDNCAELISLIKDQDTVVKDAVRALLTAPIQDGKFKSISLAETLTTWNKTTSIEIGKLDDLAKRLRALTGCGLQQTEQMATLRAYDTYRQSVKLLEEKINGEHLLIRPATLIPDHDYRVIVQEYYTGAINNETVTKLTEGGQREFTFSPISNVLVFTAGALLTTIEQRAYLSRKDPSQQEKTVLAVDGTGAIRPIGVALLNYQIPSARFGKGGDIGISLASGLTFELGATKSETSKLGWFGGFSVDIYRRLYISPGIHLGQFADFPVGLARGSIIPENFGDVNPVKRWTGRFAIAVTYRTAGVGKTSDTGDKQKE